MIQLTAVILILLPLLTNALSFVDDLDKEFFCEDTPVGTNIYTLTATGGTEPYFFRFINADSLPFSVDGWTGVVTLDKQLDYESIRSYNYEACVEDDVGQNECIAGSVSIRDINDVYPVFKNIPYVAYIFEDPWTNGLAVYDISVEDIDQGYSGSTQQFIKGSTPVDDGYVLFDTPTSMTISLNSSSTLDYETSQVHIMTITSTDLGDQGYKCGVESAGLDESLSSTTTFVLNVKDGPDMPPAFDKQYSATVNEHDNVSVITTVSAKDGDKGLSWNIVYSLENYTDTFAIDETSGEITAISDIDREALKNGQYDLVVTATEEIPADADSTFRDDTSLPLSASTTVQIQITDIDDNIPLFYNGLGATGNSTEYFETDVIEETATTLTELEIFVQDKDEGDNAAFSVKLDGDAADAFMVSPDKVSGGSPLTISVKNSSALDRERDENVTFQQHCNRNDLSDRTSVLNMQVQVNSENKDGRVVLFYTCTDALTQPIQNIVATATKSPGSNTTATVVVNILDKNDNTPKLSEADYHGNISENAALDTIVLTISATDADIDEENNKLSYEILPSDTFDIHPNIGSVYLVGKLDRELRSQYYLTVTASDGELRNSSQLVIDILDYNDNRPVFQQKFYSLSVKENSPLDTELVVTAFDADEPSTNNSNLVYSFVDGNLTSNFNITSIDGSGIINLVNELDIEESGITCGSGNTVNFEMTVVASDQGIPPLNDTATVTVYLQDENDMVPVFTQQTYNGNVSEESSVNTEIANVTAQDEDACFPNNEITYEVMAEQSNIFSMITDYDLNIGTLTVKGELDRDVEDEYNVTVFAIDNGQTRKTATAFVIVTIIDINNKNPIFDSETLDDVYVPENETIDSAIHIIIANDTDLDSDLIYSIVNPPNNWFRIENENQVGVLKINNSLDRETSTFVDLEIQVEDVNGESKQTVTGNIRIILEDIVDSPPYFAKEMYEFNILESDNVDNTVSVYQVTAIDDDENDIISYSVNDTTRMIIDEEGNLYVNSKLDRETDPGDYFYVLVTATDSAGLSNTTLLNITVDDTNDNDPIFTNSSVCQVKATDADIGENAQLRYQIDDQNNFQINSESGIISLRHRIDRETTPAFQLNVLVTDSENSPREDTAVVEINITDVDDNDPEYNKEQQQNLNILENNEPEESIGFIDEASDEDTQENSQNIYSIDDTNGEDYSKFTLNGTTRELFAKDVLDREETDKYVIHIKASAPNGNFSPNDLEVIITVDDENDNAPKFSKEIYYASIPVETQVSNTDVVMTLTATDKDAGSYGTVTYKITAQYYLSPDQSVAEPTDTFSIGETTGYVYLIRPLASVGSYDIEVNAMDGGGKTGSTKVEIQLSTNSETVIIESSLSQEELNDEETRNQMETDMEKVLSDSNDTSVVIFKIVPHDNSNYTTDVYFYAINTTTGELIPADYILAMLESRDPDSDAFISKYQVVSIDSPDVVKVTTTEDYLKAAIAVLGSLLVLFIIAFSTAIYFMRQSYKRKLKVEKAKNAAGKQILYLNDQNGSKGLNVPNTNIHSQGENPLYSENRKHNIDMDAWLRSQETNDDDDIDDNAVDSQDSAIHEPNFDANKNEWDDPGMIDIDFPHEQTNGNAKLAAQLSAAVQGNGGEINYEADNPSFDRTMF